MKKILFILLATSLLSCSRKITSSETYIVESIDTDGKLILNNISGEYMITGDTIKVGDKIIIKMIRFR